MKDGCRGAWVNPFNHNKVIHGSPEHDVLFAKCCELQVPLAIHPTFVPHIAAEGIFDWPSARRGPAEAIWLRSITQQVFISFLSLGTLDRFPDLKLGLLEVGCGWIGALLDRLNAYADAMNISSKRTATQTFREQCFISGDPDETAAAHIIDHVGPDNFMWATDYPHPDHPHTWVDALTAFVEPLSEPTRSKFLGTNVKNIYGLP